MKNNTTEKYLGPKETEVIARLSYEKVTLITIQEFDKFFEFDRALRKQIIFRLRKKNILTSIKRGVYLYSPLESGPAGSNINEFLIPPVFFPKGNYYIGCSTMYNYYGFTDQIFQSMYILNTSFQGDRVIENILFKMIKISPKRMYGLEKIKIRNIDVIVSDREKTLVDLIYLPQSVGGLKVAFEILKEQIKDTRVDVEKLVKYALKFPSVSTRKRIGYVLEQAGLKDQELKSLLNGIKRSSLITLYPSKSRKGKINKKWMVIENAP